jgi:hypothetical protein
MSRYRDLEGHSVENLLEQVTGLGAMGTKGDVQSILAVMPSAQWILGNNLIRASDKLDDAVGILGTVAVEASKAVERIEGTSGEIRNFNDSTTQLSNPDHHPESSAALCDMGYCGRYTSGHQSEGVRGDSTWLFEAGQRIAHPSRNSA